MSLFKALGITLAIFLLIFVSVASMYLLYLLAIVSIFAALVYTIKFVLDSHP